MTILAELTFNDGTLNEWTSLSDAGGDLSASAPAGLAGTSHGMAIRINGTDSPTATWQVGVDSTTGIARCRFYFDPNSLTMSNNSNHFLGNLRSASNIATFRLDYTTANGHAILCQMVRDADSVSTSSYPISDAPHWIEVQVVRATTNVSADGALDLWIDDVHKQQLTGDNYDTFNLFRQLRLGATSGVDATTSGTYYIDEIVINDDGSYIGPVTGGTVYTQSISGSITPAGALGKQTSKVTSGAIATITGALAKQTSKSFSGAIASITGGIAKRTDKVLSGTISSITGVMAKSTGKLLSGNATSAGSVAKQTNKALSGAVATIGGALDTIRLIVVFLAGSVTPSGTITKQSDKALLGALASTGETSKQSNKFLTGALSIAGTLTSIRLFVVSLSGGITPTGTIAKTTHKILSSVVASSGGITRSIRKFLTGAVGIAGTLIRLLTGTSEPTTAHYIYIVPAESRVYVIPAAIEQTTADRTYIIPAESRTYQVPHD